MTEPVTWAQIGLILTMMTGVMAAVLRWFWMEVSSFRLRYEERHDALRKEIDDRLDAHTRRLDALLIR